MQDKIICPDCGKEVLNLLSHIKCHKEYKIYDKKTFYEYFPNYDGKFQIDKRVENECKCHICGKPYKYNNLLQLHYKKEHEKWYNENKKDDNRKCATLKCPICNRMYTDIKQHINRTHRIDWIEFCEKYNWDAKLTKCVTEEYKKHLSESKTKFYYETERGKELRKIQAIKYKENNPSKNRKTIEKSIFNRTVGKGISTVNYRGVRVQYDNISFRSINEYVFYILCKYNNIKIKYEPKNYIVKWYNEEKNFITTYLPDFIVDDKILLELKSSLKEIRDAIDIEKYKKVSKIYSAKKIQYEISYPIKFFKDFYNIKYENYEVGEIVKKYTQNAIKENNIHFTCKENSRFVKFYTGLDKLENNKIITLYEIHNNK
ncbi:MAG: hypothetical protein IKO36_04380 [Bacteroidaceae bacterium]|nr:hypothetical protein [Bacteroidaceae bacterium]